MTEFFKRDSDLSHLTTAHPEAWWTSTGPKVQQLSQSRNLSFKMATPPEPCKHGEEMDFQFHDQDSSSTQSTGESYLEVAFVGENKTGGKNGMLSPKESGDPGLHGKSEEGHTISTLSNHEYTSPPSHVDYGQSFGTIPFTYTNSYCTGILGAYGPHSMAHSQMMCMTPSRVPLPLELPQDEPIYVNAKQYRAILRRREYRAKLEAHNKLSKVRKPYLHESRHRHALNRVRGPGGRFLNAKKLKESKSTTMTDGRNYKGSGHSQKTSKRWKPEVHSLEYYKEGDRTTSSSEITCAPDVDNIFHQQEFRFSVYTSPVGGTMQHRGSGIPGGIQHYLSVPQ